MSTNHTNTTSFTVGASCVVRHRPPSDRRRIVRVSGTVLRVTPHVVEIERTIIDPDTPGRLGGERTVTVPVRFVDVVSVA